MVFWGYKNGLINRLQRKGQSIKPGDFPIIISGYLEKNASEDQRKQELDIADFL